MLASTPASADSEVSIKDVAELLWEGVQRGKGVSEVKSVAAEARPLAVATNQAEQVAPGGEAVSSPVAMDTRRGPMSPATLVEDTSLSAVKGEGNLLQPEKTERKKWTPKAAATKADRNPQKSDASADDAAPLDISPSEDLSVKTPEPRKKWQPKGGKQV